MVNVREYVPVKVWPEQSQARLWPLPSWKVTVSPTAIVKLDGEKESPEVPTWYPVVDGTVVVVVTGTRVVVVVVVVVVVISGAVAGVGVVVDGTVVVESAGTRVVVVVVVVAVVISGAVAGVGVVVDGTVVVESAGKRVVVVETAVGAPVVGLSTTVVDTAGAKVSPADRSAVSEAVPPHATRASRDTPIRIRTDFIVLPLPWVPNARPFP